MIKPQNKPQEALQKQIGAALVAARQPLSRAEIADLIRQIVSSMEGEIAAPDVKFYREVEGLARYISAARAEIAAIRPKDITDQHIPTATDELDAVVGSTEEATNKIMDECDVISGIAGALPPDAAEALTTSVTRIFEACNFQDLTGQRINKVVGALKHIETKIAALLVALGDEMSEGSPGTVHAAGEDPDKKLLNGPQMPGKGVSQDDIDRLFD